MRVLEEAKTLNSKNCLNIGFSWEGAWGSHSRQFLEPFLSNRIIRRLQTSQT